MTVDHAKLIKAMPVPFLAYEAQPPYRIIDENEAHEKVALTKRSEIIGRPFLEVYPDNSEEFALTGKSAPIESIKKIVQTKKPDSLGEFKWDVPTKDGGFAKRYWRSTQYPMFDESGKTVIAVYQLTEDVTEQRLAQEQLELTKYQLDQTLADGLIGTWVWDMKGAKVFGGPNLAGMFGVTAEAAAKGLALEQFLSGIHENDRARISKEIERSIKARSTFESEYRTIDRDGKVRWLIARGRVEVDESGELERFPGVVVDISDRKESEHALEESEARLRFMADSMPQLVWVTRPDGYHEYYNQQWYDYTGTEPGSTDGDAWRDLFHPDDQARAQKVWGNSLKTGKSYEIEYRLYHAESKRYRWVIGRALPLTENGEIIKWYGTCTDIDEQKHVSDQQTFLADVSKELVAGLDIKKILSKITKLSVPTVADWCMVDLYSDADGFTQISAAHTDKKKLNDVIEYRNNVRIDINDDTTVPRVVRSGEPELIEDITTEIIDKHVKDIETRKYLKSLNLCSVMVVPLKENKRTIGAISFMSSTSGRHFNDSDLQVAIELATRVSLSMTNARLYVDSVDDLRRRKELERQLREEKQRLESRVKERTTQLQLTNQGLREEIIKRQTVEKALNTYSDELSRSNQELEDFAYVASHDLQEPLRKIRAFGNLILKEYGESLGPEGNDYLERMHSAALRMSTLIEDLLAFSRITRKPPILVDVDLTELIQDVLVDLEIRITDTAGKITIGKLPIVKADATHMRQLFQNLIGNAVKFHQPGLPPVVKISSHTKDDGFEIKVSDNGIGFDEKYLDRIFSVFQRLHERSNYEGTGIGLAVCRKIVERYSGTITAVSTKNKGSTFIIWLPNVKEKK